MVRYDGYNSHSEPLCKDSEWNCFIQNSASGQRWVLSAAALKRFCISFWHNSACHHDAKRCMLTLSLRDVTNITQHNTMMIVFKLFCILLVKTCKRWDHYDVPSDKCSSIFLQRSDSGSLWKSQKSVEITVWTRKFEPANVRKCWNHCLNHLLLADFH